MQSTRSERLQWIVNKKVKISLYDIGGSLRGILDDLKSKNINYNDVCIVYCENIPEYNNSLVKKLSLISTTFGIKLSKYNECNEKIPYCITVNIPWYNIPVKFVEMFSLVTNELHMINKISTTDGKYIASLLTRITYKGALNVESYYRSPIIHTIKYNNSGKLLYIDTETSDRYASYGHDEKNILKNSRIMSICFGLFDSYESFNENELVYTLISHKFDYTPNKKAVEVHKLTKNMCNNKGISILNCGIIEALSNTKTIVGYNVSFDYNILMSELLRYGVIVDKIPTDCAMQMSSCHLGKVYKLGITCEKLSIDISDLTAHNARDDVIMMGRILKKINK